MEFIIFIGFVFTVFKVLQLSSRVTNLERRLGEQVKVQQVPSQVVQPVVGAPQVATTTPQPRPAVAYVHHPSAPERFLAWLKEDWLLKVGAGLFLLGFGWLVTYAFMNNWIGPAGRISLCLLAGATLMAFGWTWMARHFETGSVFLGLGAGVVMMTLFAARMLYDFFDPTIVLGLCFLVSVVIALAGVKYTSSGLAVASVLLAGIAPLLTHSATSDFVSLFAYLFVVVVGAVWVVQFTGSRDPVAAALIVVGLYSLMYFAEGGSNSAEKLLLLWGSYAFAVTFFTASLIALVRAPQTDKIQSDLFIGLGTGMYVYAWTVFAVAHELQSIVVAASALVLALGAYLVFIFTNRREAFFVYAGVAVVLLGIATALEFEGPALTIAFIIEASVVTLLTGLLTKSVDATARASFVFIIPIVLSLQSFASYTWNTGIWHRDSLVLVMLALILSGTGYVLYSTKVLIRDDEKKASETPPALMIAGMVYALSFVWLASGALLSPDAGVTVSLLIYTVTGLTFYISGKTRGYPLVQKCGTILLGCVVARLLLVDIWNMELVGKIVIFFGVGALLMSTAFIGRTPKPTQPLN